MDIDAHATHFVAICSVLGRVEVSIARMPHDVGGVTHGRAGVERWMGCLAWSVSTAAQSGLGCKYVEYCRAGGISTLQGKNCTAIKVEKFKSRSIVRVGLEYSTFPSENYLTSLAIRNIPFSQQMTQAKVRAASPIACTNRGTLWCISHPRPLLSPQESPREAHMRVVEV